MSSRRPKLSSTRPRRMEWISLGYRMMWGNRSQGRVYRISGMYVWKLEGCRIVCWHDRREEKNMTVGHDGVQNYSILCLSLAGYSWDNVWPRRHARQIDLGTISGSWSHNRWLAHHIAIIWNRRWRSWKVVRGTAGGCQSIGYGIRTCGRSSPWILS